MREAGTQQMRIPAGRCQLSCLKPPDVIAKSAMSLAVE
jgi:hypothetical protein